MRRILFCSTILLLKGTGFSWAEPTEQTRLIEAAKAYRDRNWNEVLTQIEPLLAKPADDETTKLAREYAAAALHRRGEDRFRKGQIKESVADFDREVELDPESDPAHWQRGIAYYYAGLFDKGARQFERHQSVNPEDVENAVWHFLCVAKRTGGSIEQARRSLMPIKEDTRVPMKEVHELFAGKGSIDDVLHAAEKKGPRALFYAYLYIGLYLEVEGKRKESLDYIERAAGEVATTEGYMADVARVHAMIREKESAPSEKP
jgi:lipoprotein NlpI